MKFLETVYKKQYDNNDRIVLYTKFTIPDRFFEHLYDIANFLDISNYFILICSPNDLTQQLEKICRSYSSDPVPFQNLVVDIDQTVELSDSFALPKTICAIPWNHIEIRADGAISPCCTFAGYFGNIHKDTIQDTFYGSGITSLRNKFVAGKKPLGCQRCWTDESRGLTSMRQHNVKRLKSNFLKYFYEQPKVSSLDLKLQNTCNFKCRICNSTSSSMFAEEQHRFQNISLRPQSKWSNLNNFESEVKTLLGDIRNIDMYGGEPFLIKKFENILNIAVEQGHAHRIRLHYNSNGSVFPSKIVELWQHFEAIDIHFSIDAIGAQFELQRGGSWAEVEANMLKIKNLNYPHMTLQIMPAISIMNILYIDQVIEWANKHGFQIFPSYVTKPKAYDLTNLTVEAKKLILEKHKNNSWPEMQKILNLVQSLPGTDGTEFCNTTRYFDQIRKQNFAIDHPEIAKAMGYIYTDNNDSISKSHSS